ncbi:hypothetical protein [Clostridium scatologenes]|uniref:Uncharacterized protein n=1 Tax=Clostridium scatologenes TaxID=1548 RepID=A0A0E3M888_CLOSL|nr:hypothetical protein [Clostridium scatologenes]AKA68507.1 hypothetical protein CSCA_1382 [Clostridium scatologenes]
MHTYGISISEEKAYAHTITIQTNKELSSVDHILDEIKAENTNAEITDIKEALKKKGFTIKDTNIDKKGDSIDYSFDELEELV